MASPKPCQLFDSSAHRLQVDRVTGVTFKFYLTCQYVFDPYYALRLVSGMVIDILPLVDMARPIQLPLYLFRP